MLGGDHTVAQPSMVEGTALDVPMVTVIHCPFTQTTGAWSSASWTILEWSLLGLDLPGVCLALRRGMAREGKPMSSQIPGELKYYFLFGL